MAEAKLVNYQIECEFNDEPSILYKYTMEFVSTEPLNLSCFTTVSDDIPLSTPMTFKKKEMEEIKPIKQSEKIESTNPIRSLEP